MLIGRLPHRGDLMGELTKVAVENGIKAGAVQVIGALERATLGFYDQWHKSYRALPFDRNVEIVSGLGNISLRDGAPFVHLHLSISDETGSVFGGHAMEGCTIFAAEYFILPIPGIQPVRTFDETTGLHLWERMRYAPGSPDDIPPDLKRALFIP